MSEFIKNMLTKPLYLVVGAVVIVGGGYYYVTGAGTEVATLTITPEDFKQTVSVSGTVVAAEHVELGFAENGRVATVNAAVGDVVTQGAILASIENGDLAAAVAQKQAALENEQAKLLSLQNGTRPESIAIDEAAVARDTEALRDTIKSAYVAADDAVHKKVDQFFSNPRTTNAVIIFTISNATLQNILQQERIAIESTLSQWALKIADPSFVIGDPALQVDVVVKYLNQVATLLADASQALSLSSTASSLYQADINTARTTIASTLGSLTTANGALTASRGALLLAKSGTTAADIAAQAAQVKSAEAAVDTARAAFLKTIVRAPFSGIVSKMDAKRGEIVSANVSQISLISQGAFELETYVPQINVSMVKVDDPAKVTLDAYGSSVFFAAKVISVDPAESVRDGVATYKTMLAFDAADERVRSGMSANVEIVTGERPNAIVVPLGALLQEGEHSFVTMAANHTKHEVTVGSSLSVGRVEIISGLHADDVILLTP